MRVPQDQIRRPVTTRDLVTTAVLLLVMLIMLAIYPNTPALPPF